MAINQSRLPRVLLLYRVLIPSVRLCGHLQMNALAQKGLIEYRHKEVSDINNDDYLWADIVVIGRLDNPAELQLTRTFKQAGKYVIYVLDDDLLNIPDYLGSSQYYHTLEIQQSIRGIIALSDAILSPNPLLLEKYANNDQLGMLTEEAAVNMIDYCAHDPKAPVRIGFAGSVDRTDDLENVLKDALTAIKAEYGSGVEFFFFGAIPSFAEALDAQTIPYTASYDEYRNALNDAQWDIGLAPMPDTPFHACKHYNKFCEYAAAGITGVFSTYGPYLRLQREIGVGTFCTNKTEVWHQALKKLIDDHSLRERKRKEACDYARRKLDISYIADELYRMYPQVFAYRAKQAKSAGYLRHIRLMLLWSRIRTLVAAYKWKLPLHIARKLADRLFRVFDRMFPADSCVRSFIRKLKAQKVVISAYGWKTPLHYGRKLATCLFNIFDRTFPVGSRVRTFIRRIKAEKAVISAYGWETPLHYGRKLATRLFNAFDRIFPVGSPVRTFIRKVNEKN